MKAFLSVALLVTSSVFSQSLPVDLSFDQGNGFETSSLISTLTQLDNGKIFIGGTFSSYNNSPVDNMVIVNENGSKDNNFICNDCINGNITASAAQSNKVIIGGNFSNISGISRRFIARINNDGLLDESFNFNNVLPSEVTSCTISQITVVDDKIYISGGFYNSALQPVFNPLIRLNSDGSLDTTFQYDESLDKRLITSFVVESGSIMFINKITGVFKLNANGSVDDTFQFVPLFVSKPSTLCALPGGKLLLGGRFVNDDLESFVLLRYNANGSLDESFNAFSFDFLDASDGVFYITQIGGNYLATGRFTDYNGIDDFIAINSNGTINEDFDIGGLTSYPNALDTASGLFIHKLSSEKILLAGNYGKVSNTVLRNLACFNTQSLGVSDLVKSSPLSVFYNYSNCNFSSPSSIISTVEIYDLAGRLIFSDTVNSNNYSYQLQNNSILLYRITMNDGKIYTGKMIN